MPRRFRDELRISLQSKSHMRQKEESITSYCENVNHFLETYVWNDFTAETEADFDAIYTTFERVTYRERWSSLEQGNSMRQSIW